MSGNAQKTPLGISLNSFAQRKAQNEIMRTGRSLPASVVKVTGSIVQVKFEVTGAELPNVTIPLTGSEYIRIPIQVGCKGFVIALDAYLGGMSGLGGGTASLTQPGNLTALAFSPCGNSGFSSVDANALVLYGPNGVVLKSQDGLCSMTLGTSSITFSIGGTTVTINGSGVAITGTLTNNGVYVGSSHAHTGVATGGGISGPPV